MPMNPKLMYSTRTAIEARDVMIADAQREYEQTCQRAAAKFAERKRAADKAWEESRRLAKRYGHARAQIWREFHGLSDNELRMRFLLAETRTSPEADRVMKLSKEARAEQLWYMRLARNELNRRNPNRKLVVALLPDASARTLAFRLDRQRRRLEQVQRFRAGLGVPS